MSEIQSPENDVPVSVYGNFTFTCRCGGTVHVVDTVRQPHDCHLRRSLSLLLRRAAREHLGIKDGDYWPSGVADAQADALIENGYTNG